MAIYGTPKSTTRNHHHKHGKCNSSHHHGIKEGCKGTHRHCSHGHKCHHKHHHHHYRESSKSETLASSVEGKYPKCSNYVITLPTILFFCCWQNKRTFHRLLKFLFSSNTGRSTHKCTAPISADHSNRKWGLTTS